GHWATWSALARCFDGCSVPHHMSRAAVAAPNTTPAILRVRLSSRPASDTATDSPEADQARVAIQRAAECCGIWCHRARAPHTVSNSTAMPNARRMGRCLTFCVTLLIEAPKAQAAVADVHPVTAPAIWKGWPWIASKSSATAVRERAPAGKSAQSGHSDEQPPGLCCL